MKLFQKTNNKITLSIFLASLSLFLIEGIRFHREMQRLNMEKKLDDYRKNFEKLEDLENNLFERKMSKREYLGTAAGLITGGLIGIGLGRLLFPPKTEKETVTKKTTVFSTTTVTSKETLTTTKTETSTLYAPKLSKASFEKAYSSEGLNVLIRLEFDKRSSIKQASLSFQASELLSIPLSKEEENVYVGKAFIEKPKPVDYKAIWDAETVEGIKASKAIPEERRTLRMKMPLEDYDPSWEKESLDSLFLISISNYQDPEKIFLTAYQLANKVKRRPKRKEGLRALVNYSIALEQGLPFIEGHELLFDACEKNPEIVDFDPIVIEENVVKSENVPRDTWMLANFIKERPEVVSQPQKFEWINRMIQQIAWCVFDSKYGPCKWFEEKLKPTDASVWQVILPFFDYLDALPSRMKEDGIEIPFPYHDSSLLKSFIADKVNRTIALFYLFDLPCETIDKEFARKYIEEYRAKGGKGIPKDLVAKSKRIGIEGMKVFVEQLPKEYEEILTKLNNPQYKKEATLWFAQWLADRGNHGLANTVSQFIGRDYNNLAQSGTTMDEFVQIIEDTNIHGITQFLKKNWKPWDLVKFIYGYERFKAGDWGGEWEMYAYGLPLAFKAFGIPLGQMGGSGTSGNLGGPGNYSHGEFAIYGIPQTVIDALHAQKSLGRIAIGYGNGISMMSCIDGFEKDTGYAIYHGIRDINYIYLWKK